MLQTFALTGLHWRLPHSKCGTHMHTILWRGSGPIALIMSEQLRLTAPLYKPLTIHQMKHTSLLDCAIQK